VTGPLLLQARDYSDSAHWTWRLDSPEGTLIADHEVRLDVTSWQFEALADLPGYLSWHVAPDRRAQDEDRILTELGDWIGTQVLGPIGSALLRQRPATVQVSMPAGVGSATALPPFLPLELARVDGRPLGLSRISFVWQTARRGRPRRDTGGRLRALGLFSIPEAGQALNLRQEQHSLVWPMSRMTAAGKAANVRILRYGVTRELLHDVLADGGGWDIIHISGHGRPGELLLETSEGEPDRVTAAELADLLGLAGERVKLVTIADCWSAAVTAAEQRKLLGLPQSEFTALDHAGRSSLGSKDRSSPGFLATELADRLGCAVLAMRYPVPDEFATEFFTGLYERLAWKGAPLADAVTLVVHELAGRKRWPEASLLSMASPLLAGEAATALQLRAPNRGQADDYSVAQLKMAGFPPQSQRFVGRTGVLARASAALAARSAIPGVLLHGMPGSGKTACALELAHGHEHAFDRLVWYKAPDEGMAINGALTDFALTLERHLDGFQMAHLLTSEDGLAGFLPRLTELMDRRRLLLVIDNAESLLTDSGQWRDDRWAQVTDALTRHTGNGRVILTSRRVPTGLPGLRVEAVDALSADEALLLARELPHLRALVYGELPGIDRETSRQLALGVLTIAQGHPKLLELANGQAAQPDQLARLVEAGGQAWREQGGLPEGFFTSGESIPPSSTAADYWHVLAAWTTSVADTLAPGERDLFWFLCCLEEPDRIRLVLDANWADLWRRLSRGGEPPDLDLALTTISERGLASVRGEITGDGALYPVHPEVAEAGRAHAGRLFRDAVDAEAAAFWAAVHRQASGQAGDGSVNTAVLVRAGLAAVPYLTRQQKWEQAAYLLEDAFNQDPSRANAAAVLPAIEQITRHEPRAAGVLARVLSVTDPAAAYARLRAYLTDAVAASDYRSASVAAGQLIDLCRDGGRLAEALELAGQKADYTRRAGLGPWTQLADEVWRLQLLIMMGHAGQAFDDVTRLRDHMAALPTTPGPDEAISPWDVREALLGAGRSAAMALGHDDDALALSAALVASMRDRHAPTTIIARAQFNTYGPLLRLGRSEEALRVLLDCRQAFEDAHDIPALGNTLSALASAEDARGHGDAAVRLQRDALRYNYLAGDVTSVAASYHNLGNYLSRHARQPAPALACHLTAALIRTLIGIGGDYVGSARASTRAAAIDFREYGTAVSPPTDVADMCRALGDIPGTDPPGLLAALSHDPETTEQTLRDLIVQAREASAAS
jgi:tetratricopeptide (TPR) repeat protein